MSEERKIHEANMQTISTAFTELYANVIPQLTQTLSESSSPKANMSRLSTLM